MTTSDDGWLSQGTLVWADELSGYYRFPAGHALHVPGRLLRVWWDTPATRTRLLRDAHLSHATAVVLGDWPLRDTLPTSDPDCE
jgi:hypothetical protein